jgi:hypothetical protein
VNARHSVAGPFPPSPSRACQGLPWRGATLIALAVQGPPYTARASKPPPVLGAPPVEGGGGSGEKGGKWKKGPEKRLVFLADGLACSRLPGPLRVPPLAIHVPPTHAEHTTLGGHPSRSACTHGAHESSFARGASLDSAAGHTPTCAGSSGQTQKKFTEYIKPGKRENLHYDQLL